LLERKGFLKGYPEVEAENTCAASVFFSSSLVPLVSTVSIFGLKL
jgi:hypothetical protein